MASNIRFNSGPTFNFLVVVDREGLPIDVPRLVQQQLEAGGVNGRRWRGVHQQYQAFDMVTLAEAATLAAAEAIATAILNAFLVQQTATLSIDAGGATYTFPNVHLNACDPLPRIGMLVGAGATGTGLAHVLTRWNWEPTKFPSAAT